MYIEAVDIKNVRGLKDLTIDFPDPAGWHVIIGDNGTGKSTVVQSIALALVGPVEAGALRLDFGQWLRQGSDSGSISLTVRRDMRNDGMSSRSHAPTRPLKPAIDFVREHLSPNFSTVTIKDPSSSRVSLFNGVWGHKKGWFSAGFGSFRRLRGGDASTARMYTSSTQKAAAHFSLFNEDAALTEALAWLKEVDYQWLKLNEEGIIDNPGESDLMTKLKAFINSDGLLPNGVKFTRIGIDGPLFMDAIGAQVSVGQLSDGFRSVLSIVFELIRLLTSEYSFEKAFKNFSENSPQITLPGVVIIDEIDAHLHPTWQTRIGQWFTEHFPNIQFIVTTHSPLVCRAAEKGSIYRLAAPGSDEKSEKVTGVERDRLIYGNILDTYATGAFGEGVTQSTEANAKLERLIYLNRLDAYGKLPREDKAEMMYLRQIFQTNDTLAF